MMQGQNRLSARSGETFAAASAAGLAAVIAPPAALLALALLLARAVLNGARPTRIKIIDIAAPIAAAAAVAGALGLAAGVGMLFVWRVIADTRWSMAQAARMGAIAGVSRSRLAQAHMWATPLLGLAIVAYTAPHMVAGLPLDLPHIPGWVPLGCAALAGVALFDWLLRLATEWRLGSLRAAPAAHEAAHHVLFVLAYAAAQDVSAGLVVLIAWRLAHAQPRLERVSAPAARAA